MSRGPFDSAPEDTHAELMRATYEALREHGYPALTIQRIGDEFPKSKSLVYQHYDGKDDLLVALLDFLLERLQADVPGEEFEDAHEHLQALLDHSLPESVDDDRAAFTRAIESLRAQAPHDEEFREQFTRADRFFREHVADIVRDGVESGVFRDVDPERVAAFVTTALLGGRTIRASTDETVAIVGTRRELGAYVRTRLLAGDSA